MGKINTTDRKQATEMIKNHFKTKMEQAKRPEQLAHEILKETRREMKPKLDEIASLRRMLDEAMQDVRESITDGLAVTDEGKLKIEWRGSEKIEKKLISEAAKKNKPVIAKQQKALAKLQTIETRDQLTKLYKSIGLV